MKVKIGDQIFDPEETPIMLIFDGVKDRESTLSLIKNMASEATRIAFFPKGMDTKDVEIFMTEQEGAK